MGEPRWQTSLRLRHQWAFQHIRWFHLELQTCATLSFRRLEFKLKKRPQEWTGCFFPFSSGAWNWAKQFMSEHSWADRLRFRAVLSWGERNLMKHLLNFSHQRDSLSPNTQTRRARSKEMRVSPQNVSLTNVKIKCAAVELSHLS